MTLSNLLLLSATSAAAYTAPATEQRPVVDTSEASSRISCLPSSALRGATVVALGTYAGRGPRQPFLLSGSRHSVSSINVTGTSTAPIVLVVAAYEPTLWDVSAIASRVRAVVASGYYPQAVTGLAADVPVRFSSAVGQFNGSNTCGKVRYAYADIADIQGMADDIQRAIGIAPRRFFGSYGVTALPVDAKPAAEASAPDLSQIRAGVPLISEDDPQDRSQMRMLSRDSLGDGSSIRIVAWDDAGKIVRDDGGQQGAKEASSRSAGNPGGRAAPEPASSGFGVSLLWLLAFLAAAVWAVRWAKRNAHPERPSDDEQLSPRPTRRRSPLRSASDDPPADPLDAQLASLTELAGFTGSEPLVVALYRYGREVKNLTRTQFDRDLADEVGSIVGRHFDHAADRYRHARPSLEGDEAERADKVLLLAIERLTGRLQELGREQHARDLDGITAAGRFIDSRHPG